MTAQFATASNTLDISAVVHVGTGHTVLDSIDIDATVGTTGIGTAPDNEVDISDEVNVVGDLIQYDTWRSVPRFDNQFFLICRTPLNAFDSPTGLGHMTLWTVDYDGVNERTRIGTPASEGWDSYSHPEWSPDGQEVVIAVETSTEYQLVVVDASGWS